MSRFHVVLCGGGIAAIEGLLRLRRLAGENVEVTLIAPNEELVYRPPAVKEPFGLFGARRYPLSKIVAGLGAEWLRASLGSVDVDQQRVLTDATEAVAYDALLIAVGGRKVSSLEHALVFNDAQADETYRGLVQDIEGGYTKHVVFVLPHESPTWPLPLYELALMTAERAYEMNVDELDLTLVNPEPAPLAVFGERAASAVSALLEEAKIRVINSARAKVGASRQVTVEPSGEQLEFGRIVALPRIVGPSVPGIAGGGALGFIPVDEYCRVPATQERVFAAGDATTFPIKHGGLGAQQADTAAAGIARLAGADVDPEPYRPEIRGMLLTGRKPLFLQAQLVAGEGFESVVSDEPLWSPVEKIAAEELNPYLASLDPQAT